MKFRILGLIFSLAVVVYGMSYLKSNDGTQKTQGFFELFANEGQKPFNWCGADIKRLVVLEKEVLATEYPLYCEQIIDTTFSALPTEDFRPIAMAESEADERVLEMNSEGVFRAGGLPFKAGALSKRLKDISN